MKKKRIARALKNAPDKNANDILEYIINDFNLFIKDKKNISDDLTIIVLKRKV